MRAVPGATQGISSRRTYIRCCLLLHVTPAQPSSHGCNVSPATLLPTTRSISSNGSFYSVIHVAETSFLAVHSFTHLPWWGVVISTTVLLRSILTLPLAVYQNRIIAKMELLLPTLKEYQEAVKHNVIVKCRRENLPLEEANRRLKKAVSQHSQFVDVYLESWSHSQTLVSISFHSVSRLKKWLVISMPRRVAAHIELLFSPGSSCHCGSRSPLP